jgi:rubredoxin
MKSSYTVKINFMGGIISPGDLYNILVAATKAHVYHIRFGLRQQLYIDISTETLLDFTKELDTLGIMYETDADKYPNIISSYAAEEVFITKTWLSEGVYKDIFDLVDYTPQLKINVSDSNQSFTPLLTGNINWVASPGAQHFWHLFIRFPKTNVVYEWKEMVYTNDVARMSKHIETIIFENKSLFYDNPQASGEELFKRVNNTSFITKPIETSLQLPLFNLPYYEGLNRYNNKYWLGIYRRDELFSIGFLKDLCLLCLQTKVGQVCATPWKSLIIKGIEEKDRQQWNDLLAKHQINVRHAANELNFQVEDNSSKALAIKNYLVKHLSADDTRTFGICMGIKTRSKSEVFSSILIRRRPLLRLGRWELLHVFDILCAKNFNPNERTGLIFSKSNPKSLLPEQLRRAILAFYAHQQKQLIPVAGKKITAKEKEIANEWAGVVHQCKHCFTVYDEKLGDAENNIIAGSSFLSLPASYCCAVCEAPKADFELIERKKLALQTI